MKNCESELGKSYACCMACARNKKLKKSLLEAIPTCAVKEICNHCYDLYRNPARKQYVEKNLEQFRKHKKLIATLADKKIPINRKRKFVQSGGIFPLLALLPLLAGLGKAAAIGAASAAGAAGVGAIANKIQNG